MSWINVCLLIIIVGISIVPWVKDTNVRSYCLSTLILLFMSLFLNYKKNDKYKDPEPATTVARHRPSVIREQQSDDRLERCRRER